MTQDMITLGFTQIIQQLQDQAVSRAARQKLAETGPILHEGLCKARMEETTAARCVMDNAGTPPLTDTEGTEAGLIQAAQGGMLLPARLTFVARFCSTIQRLRRYLQSVQIYSAGIASWHSELPDLNELQKEIENAVREDAVLDDASPALKNMRRQREYTERSIREKLNQVMLHHKRELADNFITQRNGYYVVPVQKKYQSAFPGMVVDLSSRGGTVFMEPSLPFPVSDTIFMIIMLGFSAFGVGFFYPQGSMESHKHRRVAGTTLAHLARRICLFFLKPLALPAGLCILMADKIVRTT